MVIYELVKAIVDAAVGFAGWRGAPVAAVALIVVGFWYSREAAGLLVGIARWLRIGGVLVAGLAGLLVVGIATGALSLDSGLVPRIVRLVTDIAGTLS